MELTLYQVDAFTDQVFKGNPAAIVPLDTWLPDALLQSIALENNLSETAYFVPGERSGQYHLRWFTPKAEVDLCGHATLATAYVIFNELASDRSELTFETVSGPLTVVRNDDGSMRMDFPAFSAEVVEDKDILTNITQAIGARPLEVYRDDDLMAVFGEQDQVARLAPRAELGAALNRAGARGLIVTAPGADPEIDFVSRFFAPNHGIPEDPVTGSAHCLMTPFWSERLAKTTLVARQISQRSGDLTCTMAGNRVELSGRCAFYMRGQLQVS